MVAATRRRWFTGLCVAVSLVVAGAAFGDNYLDYFERGEFALQVQNWDRAVGLFTKAIRDNPKFYPAYRNRAIAYSKTGAYEKSLRDLQTAVKLNPDYPEAYGLMGVVYEIKRDYASALKAYQRALSLEKRAPLKRALKTFIEDVQTKMRRKR